MPTKQIRSGDAPLNGRRGRMRRRVPVAAWLVAACLWCAAPAALAVDFPGPRRFPLPASALSVMPVRMPGQATDDLLVGTATGRLMLYRYSVVSNSLQIRQEILIGGRLTAMQAWSGLPLTDRGAVVAGADPDKVWFVRVRSTYPYLQVATSVDLDEDPGSLAWFGDVDGGHPQLAVSLPGLDAIAVLAADPSWRLAGSLAVGDQPASVTGADLDGDGLRELVAAERGYLSGDLVVGSPGAAPGEVDLRFATVPGTVADLVSTIDDDGDGIDELVVADRDQARLVVVAPEGQGFAVRHELALTVPVGSLHRWAQNDGTAALVVANQGRGAVECAARVGGAWVRQGAYFPGCLPACVVTAELNGDGLPDLAAVGGEVLSMMFARSSNAFWGLPSLALSDTPGDLAHGDFDGDGRVDLLVSPTLGGTLSLFPGQAEGLAATPVAQPLAFTPGRLAAVQLDADTPDEVAVLDMLAGEIVVMEGDQGGLLAEAARLPVGPLPTFLAAGDVDGDGHPDLLALHADPSSVQLFFGNGGASFPAKVTLTYDIGSVRAALVDLNGDGRLDVVGVDGSSRMWWRLNLDGRSFGPGQWVNAGAGAVLLATGDLDGDGDQDVVVGCRIDRSLVAFENQGTGTLVRRTGSTMLESEPFDVRVVDLDQDGSGDVVVNLRDQDRLDLYLSIVPWNQTFNLVLPGTPDVAALDVVDADRDGVQDLVALDAALQLGVIHRNVDPTNVPVEPQALACVCGPRGGLAVRIETGNLGAWELTALGPDGRLVVAADGRAQVGRLTPDGDAWDLALSADDLAAVGPLRALTLRCEGVAGAPAEHVVAAPAGCGGAWRDAGPAWRAGPWPNPGNPAFSARFFVPRAGPVCVTVCDLGGRRVAVLHDGELAAGEHEVQWDGRGAQGAAAAGTYLMVVDVAGERLARKLVLLR